MKVIKSLENRGMLSKGTTRRTTSLEGGCFKSLRPLMTANLPLLKRVLTPLPKSILIPLGLSAGMSAVDVGYSKEKFWIRLSSINNCK